MKSYLQTIVFAVLCLTYSLSTILNTLGIYTLSNLRHELTNQRILLMNLSFSELLYTAGLLCYYVMDRFQFLNKSTNRIIMAILTWFLYYLYLTSPLLLTIDRFIAIAFPWKYRSIFNKTKAVMMVLSTWMCVLFIAVPALLINDYETARQNYLWALALGIELTVVGFSIVAYTLIELIVLRQRKLAGRANTGSKILKVATIIIITYVLLEVIPSVVLTVLFQCCNDFAKAYRRLFYSLRAFNTVSDPIIYIYNYPPLKKAVKKKLELIIITLGCLQQQSFTMAVPSPDHLSTTTRTTTL